MRSWFRRTLSGAEQAAAEAPPPDTPGAPSATPGPVSTGSEPAEGSDTPKRRATRGGRGQKKKRDDEGDGSAPASEADESGPPAKKKRKAAASKTAGAKADEGPKKARRRSETPRRSALPAVRKEMLVSIDAGEQRVAVLEDGQVVEVYLERPGRSLDRRKCVQGDSRHRTARHGGLVRRHRAREERVPVRRRDRRAGARRQAPGPADSGPHLARPGCARAGGQGSDGDEGGAA